MAVNKPGQVHSQDEVGVLDWTVLVVVISMITSGWLLVWAWMSVSPFDGKTAHVIQVSFLTLVLFVTPGVVVDLSNSVKNPSIRRMQIGYWIFFLTVGAMFWAPVLFLYWWTEIRVFLLLVSLSEAVFIGIPTAFALCGYVFGPPEK